MVRKRAKTDSSIFETQFENWLNRIAENEMPPASLLAFNIGLFETQNGYAAYLIGANFYSEEDDDWACNEAFTPQERYFYFPDESAKKISWEKAEAVMVEAVKRFLNKNPNSFLAKADAITVGSDEGDLVRVK